MPLLSQYRQLVHLLAPLLTSDVGLVHLASSSPSVAKRVSVQGDGVGVGVSVSFSKLLSLSLYISISLFLYLCVGLLSLSLSLSLPHLYMLWRCWRC